MKKYINVLMLLAVVVFGLCSCEDDKDPVLQKPTEFVLNQPATSELYYALNPTATLNLTFSQPNYGPGIIAKYFVQVSLTRELPTLCNFQRSTPLALSTSQRAA